jgi:hypothetical protein
MSPPSSLTKIIIPEKRIFHIPCCKNIKSYNTTHDRDVCGSPVLPSPSVSTALSSPLRCLLYVILPFCLLPVSVLLSPLHSTAYSMWFSRSAFSLCQYCSLLSTPLPTLCGSPVLPSPCVSTALSTPLHCLLYVLLPFCLLPVSVHSAAYSTARQQKLFLRKVSTNLPDYAASHSRK